MNTDDLERLLAERERIALALKENERALLERHTADATVLFTDIVGSTRYFEEHGDVEGMKLLHRHNELLFPVVERHGGRLIKTIGDAILATFGSPDEGVRCAVELHRTLRQANARGDGPELHIRAGLHHGRVFLANDDVFGDTVNTAARVVHAAQADELLVSQALVEKLSRPGEVRHEPRGSLSLKGKAEPFPVVAIDWGLEGGGAGAEPIAGQRQGELFVLEIQSSGHGLKVSAIDGPADKGTVRAYAERDVTAAQLEETTRAFATFMHGGGAGSYVPRIRAEGEKLFEQALSDRAKRHLRETPLSFLRLHLDDGLVQVPWELMHDGKEFLGLRFALGRNVAARTEESVAAPAPAATPFRPTALIAANPSGDLRAALKEGEALHGLFQEGYAGEVKLLRGPLRRADFIAALRGCAVLHFAGHIEQPRDGSEGGFVCADGLVTPTEVRAAVGDGAPGLVFANGCHATSGRGFAETARGVSDLASSLLLRGCRDFIGPSWAVDDDDALTFALRFHERALAGVPFGEAARQARAALLGSGRQPLSFAGYVLYGDPRSGLPREHVRLSGRRTRSARESADHLDVRKFAAAARTTEAAAPPSPAPSRARRLPVIGGAVAAVAALALGGVFIASKREEPPAAKAVVPPVESPPPAVAREGPIRLTVLPFKNVSGEASLEYLEDSIAETVTTDFSGDLAIRLIERGQIGLNLQEIDFGKGEYVDKATRAEIGKISGAEVAVIGGYQRAGAVMRANARFVQVETGEVLHAVKVERASDDLFALQDAVASELRAALPSLKTKLRP